MMLLHYSLLLLPLHMLQLFLSPRIRHDLAHSRNTLMRPLSATAAKARQWNLRYGRRDPQATYTECPLPVAEMPSA